MRVRSVRARLTLWYAAVTAALLLALGGIAYALLTKGLAHDVDAALEGVAKALADSSLRESPAGPGRDIDEIFQEFFGPLLSERFFRLLDPFGQLDPRMPGPTSSRLPLSAEALQNASRGLSTFETVQGLSLYPVRILTMPVVERGRVVNVVQVGMSLEPLHMAQRRFLFALALLLPVGLLLAGGGGWFLARRALRPVDEMTAAARRIGAGSLRERIQDLGVDDELGRLAQTLNQMLDRLEAVFAQIRQFSADAAHELRTPLTVLRGEMELGLRAARPPEEYQALLASALDEVHRMTRLVEDLLFLARADAGAMALIREPVDLAGVLQEVAKRGEVLAEPHGITLSLGPVVPITVLGDRQRLLQLFLNLVDNAVKYTPEGGQVTLSLEVQGPSAVAAVRDTGIGIAPQEQGRIFDRFYRVDKARSREGGGSGLGLCIARSIAEVHGGSIQVESAPGRGSTFSVRLPLA